MENSKNEIDYYEETTFHPSLDIKNGILVLGFRVKPEIDREGELFVVATASSVQTVTGTSFTTDGELRYIDTKKRQLAKLAQQWSKKDLDTFLRAEQAGNKIPTPIEIFDKLKSLLAQHLDIDEADATLLCAWVVGTYFFPLFSAYPYLHIKAPKGSGKSQCLSFLQQTCFNATKARASLPALRDTVDSLRGTYLMDQADALHRPYMEDLLDILTDSYKRGGGAVRKMVADKGKSWNLEEFQAYSPKAFASINQLPEDLRDRCFIISLVRSSRNFKPLDEESPAWKEMRGLLYQLLIGNFIQADSYYLTRKIEYGQQENPTFVGRQLELWLPFEIMFLLLCVPDAEQQEAKERFMSQYNFAEYQVSELERAIIETVRELIGEQDSVVLSPMEISETVESLLFDDAPTEKHRASITGKLINKFNLPSEKLTRSSQGIRYLFKKEQVEKVYQAYFSAPIEEEHAPSYTPETDVMIAEPI